MWGQVHRRAQVLPEREPAGAIAGPIVSSLRSMMRERGHWPQVKQAFLRRHPQDGQWLEEPTWSVWVDIERHVAMLEAASEVMGLDGLHDLGRQRLATELRAGIFASIVRSWLRSFAEHPGYLLRVVPYLWRAGFRDCGQMLLVESGDDHIAYRLEGAPSHLVQSEAWQALLRGFGEGLFELGRVDGSLDIGAGDGVPPVLMLGATWSRRQTA